MISVPVTAHLLGSPAVRRVLGCGCAVMAALIALPVLVLVSLVDNLSPAVGGAASNQVDATTGMVIGSAQPLPPRTFRVSQGYGCTNVAREPSPPPGDICPPDADHGSYRRFHTGIDLAAASGVTVFAVVDGTVKVVESNTGFGIHIVLSPTGGSGARVTYLYGHLSQVAVPDGDVVRAGDPVGYVGSTGNSSGSHLHFEVDVRGSPVNPCSAFPRGYLLPAGVAASGCLAWGLSAR